MTLAEFLKKLGLCENRYPNHNTLLLKQSPAEIRNNCYNPNPCSKPAELTWTLIQFVLDPYACAVYILSYITKGQRGVSKLLCKASEEAEERNKDIVNKVRHIHCKQSKAHS